MKQKMKSIKQSQFPHKITEIINQKYKNSLHNSHEYQKK